MMLLYRKGAVSCEVTVADEGDRGIQVRGRVDVAGGEKLLEEIDLSGHVGQWNQS